MSAIVLLDEDVLILHCKLDKDINGLCFAKEKLILINENKPKEHWLIIESHELAHYRLYKYGNPEWKSHSKAFFKEYKDLLVNYVKLSKSDFLWTYYNTEYNKYVLNKK